MRGEAEVRAELVVAIAEARSYLRDATLDDEPAVTGALGVLACCARLGRRVRRTRNGRAMSRPTPARFPGWRIPAGSPATLGPVAHGGGEPPSAVGSPAPVGAGSRAELPAELVELFDEPFYSPCCDHPRHSGPCVPCDLPACPVRGDEPGRRLHVVEP